MPSKKIIVIPPTHEQSTPSFHVEASLAQPFLAFLKRKGITAWQPPEPLNVPESNFHQIMEIEIEANTPESFLEGLIKEFHSEQHTSTPAP